MEKASSPDRENDDDIVISLIIISWNTREILRKCLDKIADAAGSAGYETIVVDNGSSDGSQEMVRGDFPEVRLIENRENLGFPKAVNQGIVESRGRYLGIMNSDTLALPGSLKQLVQFLEDNPETGAVGPQLISTDNHLQYSGGYAPSPFSAFNELAGVNLLLGKRSRKLFIRSRSQKAAVSVDWLCAACLVVRRSAVDDAGMFDDTHFMYAEDIEFGLRLRAHGWKLHFLPGVRVIHYGGASSAGVPETKLMWLGGLFRVAAGRMSRVSYSLFGILLSLAYLERTVLLSTARAMPGLDRRGAAHARDAATYAKTALRLGLKKPEYSVDFSDELEHSFQDAHVRDRGSNG